MKNIFALGILGLVAFGCKARNFNSQAETASGANDNWGRMFSCVTTTKMDRSEFYFDRLGPQILISRNGVKSGPFLAESVVTSQDAYAWNLMIGFGRSAQAPLTLRRQKDGLWGYKESNGGEFVACDRGTPFAAQIQSLEDWSRQNMLRERIFSCHSKVNNRNAFYQLLRVGNTRYVVVDNEGSNPVEMPVTKLHRNDMIGGGSRTLYFGEGNRYEVLINNTMGSGGKIYWSYRPSESGQMIACEVGPTPVEEKAFFQFETDMR